MAYVSNTREIRRLLRNAGVERVGKALGIIQGGIERRTPRQSGRLAGSYETRVQRQPKRIKGEVGTPVFYSIFPEFGTVNQDAKPYFRPGYQDAREKALDVLKEPWF